MRRLLIITITVLIVSLLTVSIHTFNIKTANAQLTGVENQITANDTGLNNNNVTIEKCIMPPCPPGKVCNQVCPESVP
jgi:hypothetical protein